MITIELGVTNILVAVLSSAVSVLATWYFSRRHYMRRTQPLTENDIKLERDRNEFRFAVFLLVFLALVLGPLVLLMLR